MIKTNACNERTRIIWLRDNYAPAKGMNAIIHESDPDVIVFNRGAHFTNNYALSMGLNETLTRALEWQKDCDERNDKRECFLIWRTTAPPRAFPIATMYRAHWCRQSIRCGRLDFESIESIESLVHFQPQAPRVSLVGHCRPKYCDRTPDSKPKEYRSSVSNILLRLLRNGDVAPAQQHQQN